MANIKCRGCNAGCKAYESKSDFVPKSELDRAFDAGREYEANGGW